MVSYVFCRLEIQPQTELNLSRIGGGSWLAKAWQGSSSRTEDIVRELQIGAVENVEAFDDCFELYLFAETKTPAEPQIE